jgi:hypothetical protein
VKTFTSATFSRNPTKKNIDILQSYQQSSKRNNVNYILPLQPSSIFLFPKLESTPPKDPDKKKKNTESNFKVKKAESKAPNDPSKPIKKG